MADFELFLTIDLLIPSYHRMGNLTVTHLCPNQHCTVSSCECATVLCFYRTRMTSTQSFCTFTGKMLYHTGFSSLYFMSRFFHIHFDPSWFLLVHVCSS